MTVRTIDDAAREAIIDGRHATRACPDDDSRRWRHGPVKRHVMPLTAVVCGVACKLLACIPGLPILLMIAFGLTYATFTIAGVTGLILVFVFDDLTDLLRKLGGGNR